IIYVSLQLLEPIDFYPLFSIESLPEDHLCSG
ncbi:unnamed protein product, partial [Rotaria socialis]